MSKRNATYRLVKIHRSYLVRELAELFAIHPNTVLNWVKAGLHPIDTSKPMLIHGQEVVTFLKNRKIGRKQKCRPWEMYCLRCRAPQKPAESMADYSPTTATTGNLIALCPVCGTIMNKIVSLAKISSLSEVLDITFLEGVRHRKDRTHPSLNCDLHRGVQR